MQIRAHFCSTTGCTHWTKQLRAESSHQALGAEGIYTPQLGMGLSRTGPEGHQGKHKTEQEHKLLLWLDRSRTGRTGQKRALTGGWGQAETLGKLVGSTVLLCSPGTWSSYVFLMDEHSFSQSKVSLVLSRMPSFP